MLIIIRSKLYYTASGIVTTVGGRPVRRLGEDCSPVPRLREDCSPVPRLREECSPVRRLREDCSPLSTCAPDGHLQCVTIPDAV